MCSHFENQYRITKYNPKYRVDNVYTLSEWTAISDIGIEFNGKILTEEEYLKIEHSYLSVIRSILLELSIAELQVTDFCSPNECDSLNNTTLASVDEILMVAKNCLREKCWCKLVGDNFFIHFGYDYYMYIGAPISLERIQCIANENNLYAERILNSPYLFGDGS